MVDQVAQGARNESNMADGELAEGDILVYAKVQDTGSRVRLRCLLDDLPGERVDGNLYEVVTSDWDEGLWDEVANQMREIIDPATDTLLFWRVVGGRLLRTSLAGRFA